MTVKEQSTTPSATPAQPVTRIKRTRVATNTGPIEQAIALREALRNSAAAANLLKQRQRQNRLVESTLQSPKQLHKVAG